MPSPAITGGRHVERAVIALNQASARTFRVQQVLHAFEALVVGRDLGARHVDVRGRALLHRIGTGRQHGVGEVDRAVGREAPVGQHREERLTLPEHVRRHAGERLARLAVLADDTDAAVAFTEQDAAVGQEAEPRGVQFFRERLDREGLGLRWRWSARLPQPRRQRLVAVGGGALAWRLLPGRQRGRPRNRFGLGGNDRARARHTPHLPRKLFESCVLHEPSILRASGTVLNVSSAGRPARGLR
jgi:hypothetical protein